MEQVGPKAKFVVGLGNPGRRYRNTRHNVGYMVLCRLRERWSLGRGKSKFQGRCWTGSVAGQPVTLLAPKTYMNRSGLAVAEMMSFYKADPAAVLIVLDDIALAPGRLRLRARGSAGGHKGLTDILQAVGADQLPRLRVGIGAPPEGTDATAYVLGRFRKEEIAVIEEAMPRAADAVEAWLTKGITYSMDRYNRPVAEATEPQEDGKGL